MLGEQLQAIRKELGFSSARAFYQGLSEKARLDFNYSYYMKIEAGQLLPSPKIINQLAALMTKEHMEKVILSYCMSLFPQQNHLFRPASGLSSSTKSSSKNKVSKEARKAPSGHQVLTEKQIAALAQHREAYFLFLLLSLARNGLPEAELTRFFSSTALVDAKNTLLQIKLAYADKQQLFPSHPFYSFPKPDSKSIQALYRTIDRFDQERDAFFKLERKVKGSFFRRISSKNSELLTKNIELLFQTIRLADDSESSQNDLAIFVSVNFSAAKLPG